MAANGLLSQVLYAYSSEKSLVRPWRAGYCRIRGHGGSTIGAHIRPDARAV